MRGIGSGHNPGNLERAKRRVTRACVCECCTCEGCSYGLMYTKKKHPAFSLLPPGHLPVSFAGESNPTLAGQSTWLMEFSRVRILSTDRTGSKPQHLVREHTGSVLPRQQNEEEPLFKPPQFHVLAKIPSPICKIPS